MFAELTIRTHRASTRIFQVILLDPELDLIRTGALHLCSDRSLLFGQSLDLSIEEIVLAAFERSLACHTAESGAFEEGRKGGRCFDRAISISHHSALIMKKSIRIRSTTDRDLMRAHTCSA